MTLALLAEYATETQLELKLAWPYDLFYILISL